MSKNPTSSLFHAGYGCAELGVSSIESFLRLYLLIYLTSTLGLDADMAGYAVSIGILWDAFADPIMGKLSDKTSTRFGRRLPWIILGTPILAVTFILIFRLTPLTPNASTAPLFLEVALLNILLNTAMTMVSVPHLAMGNEISISSPTERTAIYAWRSVMTLFGLLIGILVPAIFNAMGLKMAYPEFIFAVIIASITGLSSLVTIYTCRSHLAPVELAISDEKIKVSEILKHKVGRLMFAFFVATLAQGLNSTLAMYYYRFSLQLDDQAIGKILILFIISLCCTIPLWVMASNKFSKSRLIALGTVGLGIVGSIGYPFFPAHQMEGPYLMAVLGGVLLGTTGLLESLLVDTAELQGLHADTMGLVFGLWKFMAKSARAAAIAVGGKLLAFSGYSPSLPSSPNVATNIAWLFGPGVGILFVIAGIILLAGPKKTNP